MSDKDSEVVERPVATSSTTDEISSDATDQPKLASDSSNNSGVLETSNAGSQSIPTNTQDQTTQSTGVNEEQGSQDATATTQSNEEPSATLYCPKTKRLHSSLLDFGILCCPSCSQDISDKTDPNKKDDSSSKPKEEPSKNKGGADVLYNLTFRDSGDYFITNEPLPGPFDLAEAKKAKKRGDDPIITVVTVLRTSHSEDRWRSRREVKDLMEEGVLENPRIDVRVQSTTIEIYSGEIIRTLRKLVHYYPGVNLDTSVVMLGEPYAVVYHYLAELEAYRSTFGGLPDAEERPNGGLVRSLHEKHGACDELNYKHTGVLLEHVQQPLFIDRIQEEQARHRHDPPLCTYQMLWLLYKPGTTVYADADGILSAFIIQSVEVDPGIISGRLDKLKPYEIKLWGLDFDGRYVRRRTRKVTFPTFDGERPITTLMVIPCEFQDRSDGSKMRDRLIREGRQWYDLLKGGQIYYDGLVFGSPNKKLVGRVVVDSTSYINFNPGAIKFEEFEINDFGEGLVDCPCNQCHGLRPHPPKDFPWTDYDVIDPKTEKTLELDGPDEHRELRYLLCPRYQYGFALKSRSWEILNIAYCSPPKINPQSIEYLVLEEDLKRMIKALVNNYATSPASANNHSREWGADFVDSKGEGKIFLLHGDCRQVPNKHRNGRQLTEIECIADFTGRPLLALTCGDLGTNEKDMEMNLTKWFKLGEEWGAVMLLDEADVYLEKRQFADIHRNSLVTVFLRCMEYYKGVLFLTTNRVGSFDDAFVSRIHVVIHYKDLGEVERRKIWEQFFDKLARERPHICVPRKTRNYVLNASEMTRLEWNGREIRNAFQTAVALAEYRHSTVPPTEDGERAELDRDDFDQVCEMTTDFKQYLDDVHGRDENARAYNEKARAY
ncbi:ATPase [Whalleya microplaca]|nr:ATPase [Whalleya microplaca]